MPYGRIVEVFVAEPGTAGRNISSVRPDGRPGISINFSIDHARKKQPGRCVLRLYNVSDETAEAFESTTSIVRVEIGYEDEGTFVAFTGNPVPGGVFFQKQGADRVLHVEAQDGGRRYRIGRVDVSFSEQISAQTVFDEIIRQTSYPRGEVDLATALPFVRGYVFSGMARDALDEFVGHINREWFVRDGSLYVIDARNAVTETAPLFSSANGNLIGSPNAIKIDKVRGIEVHALPVAGMKAGKPFKVESRDYNGFYMAQEVSYRGSSYDGRFEVIVRGVPR